MLNHPRRTIRFGAACFPNTRLPGFREHDVHTVNCAIVASTAPCQLTAVTHTPYWLNPSRGGTLPLPVDQPAAHELRAAHVQASRRLTLPTMCVPTVQPRASQQHCCECRQSESQPLPTAAVGTNNLHVTNIFQATWQTVCWMDFVIAGTRSHCCCRHQ